MAESLLQMDLARAIQETVLGNATLFSPAVELTDGEARVEIGRTAKKNSTGRNRLLIRPEVEAPVEGQTFEGSNLVDIGFTLIFDTKDVNDADAALSIIGSAVQGAFGDGGAQAIANLTDTGDNLVGSPGQLTVGQPQETESPSGPDFIAVAVLLTWRVMAKIPRTHTV
jgi:hypothetical protein